MSTSCALIRTASLDYCPDIDCHVLLFSAFVGFDRLDHRMQSNAVGDLTDIGPLLDHGKWTRRHWLVATLAGAVVILDGVDSQALSFSLPAVSHDWHKASGQFAPALATGLLGVSLGSVVGGSVGDRVGRRPVLVVSVLLFGILTIATSTVAGLNGLTILRLLTSVGFGAAMPTAVAFVSEVAPTGVRSLCTTFTVACFPLGGMAGGFLAKAILPTLGWRWLFITGGCLACLLALLIAIWLPESPRYLVRRPPRWPEISPILRSFGIAVGSADSYTDSTERPRVRTSINALFGKELRQKTLMLWLACSFGLFAMQLLINWAPALFVDSGMTLDKAILGLSMYNLGGTIASATCGLLAAYIELPWITIATMFCATLVALVLSHMGFSGTISVLSLTVALTMLGAFAQSSQTALHSLGAQLYPTSVRATGAGATIAVGRGVAAAAGAFCGPILLRLGVHAYFLAVSGASTGALAALILLRWASIQTIRRASQSIRPPGPARGD